MLLSDRDFALVQGSVERLMERIYALGLSLSVETDFRGLKTFLQEVGSFVYPSFDPDRCTLSRDAFWFRLVDPAGRTVASHADRIFRNADLMALIRSGHLWFDDDGHGLDPAAEVIAPATAIAGTIGHSGSLWIDPAWRSKGLSLYLPYLSRSISMLEYGTDWHTGLVFKQLAETPVPRQAYGYPHVDLCLRGPFPPTRREEEVYVCLISRAESVEALRRLARHPRFPVAAAVAGATSHRLPTAATAPAMTTAQVARSTP